MPTLTLKFNKKIIREYRVETGASITIGRRKDNDIVIENLAVSGEHAKIDSIGDRFLLTDLQSKNGSFVNEKLITTHYLNHDDAITIGKHTLVFNYDESEKKPTVVEPAVGMDATMVMDTEQHRAMLESSKKEANAAKKHAENAPIGVLSYLSGGEGEIELTKKMIKIGKESTSDIVVSGFMVGKPAATISRRPNGYYLSYVSGMAKPKVNGEVVKKTVKLNEFDAIEIGSVKLQFVLNEPGKK